MTYINGTRCDQCDAFAPRTKDRAYEDGWFTLRQLRVSEIGAGHIHTDLCSITCLSKWISAKEAAALTDAVTRSAKRADESIKDLADAFLKPLLPKREGES